MSDIKVPVFSESVTEGTLLSWNKKVGDSIKRGDVLAEIETDKVVLEVTALADGVLQSVAKNEGDTVYSEEVLGTLGEGGAAAPAPEAPSQPAASQASQPSSFAPAPSSAGTLGGNGTLSPAVRKIVEERQLDAAQIVASGPKGNITKADALNAQPNQPGSAQASSAQPSQSAAPQPANVPSGPRAEQRVPMTRIRQRIAERLKEVQNTDAILTTFNEVNMKPVMDLRKKYQDQFVAKHGVKLGFMSLFVRAATEALKAYPIINASVDGKDIIYHGYYDLGIAVASERGLVVPVLRDTDAQSLADIEKNIAGFAQKAKAGKLTMEDMAGGTFSITNGGTFGSMLSTPIINQPQSAILGMHNIIERPIAQNGQVVIAPMMYLALSYDHRIIDGKDAVLFLVAIKNLLEDPARMLLDL